MALASSSVWIIKHAFDQLGVPVTVIGFSTNHTVLSQKGDKAKANVFPVYPAQASTDPTTALQEALRIFSRSNAANKLLITVTDGAWAGYGGSHNINPDQLVTAINRTGVTSVILGLNNAVSQNGKHKHIKGRDIVNVAQVVDVASDMTAEMMKRAGAINY